jgi:hypothetical protein
MSLNSFAVNEGIKPTILTVANAYHKGVRSLDEIVNLAKLNQCHGYLDCKKVLLQEEYERNIYESHKLYYSSSSDSEQEGSGSRRQLSDRELTSGSQSVQSVAVAGTGADPTSDAKPSSRNLRSNAGEKKPGNEVEGAQNREA